MFPWDDVRQSQQNTPSPLGMILPRTEGQGSVWRWDIQSSTLYQRAQAAADEAGEGRAIWLRSGGLGVVKGQDVNAEHCRDGALSKASGKDRPLPVY